MSIDLKEPIFLIGMMGSWKSTVGRKLAQKINLNFIDTDNEVELRLSKSIVDIFRNDGETYFRKIESEVFREITKDGSKIISTGGGIILMPENRLILNTKGHTIYLKARPEVLANRISNIGKRPLLNSSPLVEQLSNIFYKRKSLYIEVAHFTLDTELMTANEVTEKLNIHLHANDENN